MKILIIQTAFIGDVILATALVEKLSSFYPSSQLDFLLRAGNAGLLTDHPKLRKVLVFDKSNKYRNLLNLIRQIRAERYDYVINLQRFFTTGLITILSGGKHTIGFDKNPLSWLFTKKVEHEIGEGHEIDRNQQLISFFSDNQPAKPKLYPSLSDRKRVAEYVEGEYICIAPTSVWYTKQYYEAGWVEFLNKISKNITVYLIGAQNDIVDCERIIKKVNSKVIIINLAGKLSLLQSAVLMEYARMNFVNDSAPMHLCSAVNAPVAAVFCSTVPEFGFGPLSACSHIIQTKQLLDCRPCGLHGHRSCPKGHFDCAKGIDVGKMVDLVDST